MTLKDIKIGQNIKEIRKTTFNVDNIVIERFPSFAIVPIYPQEI